MDVNAEGGGRNISSNATGKDGVDAKKLDRHLETKSQHRVPPKIKIGIFENLSSAHPRVVKGITEGPRMSWAMNQEKMGEQGNHW